MAANDRAILTPDLMAHIHFCAPLGLVYMMNPKAACSTIKQSLWKRCDTINGTSTYPGHPHHDRNRAPFNYAIYPADILPAHADDFHRATIFTTVRNPYSRMLSAYLEKIWDEDRDKEVWPVFAQRFDLAWDARPAFMEFLDLVGSEDPYLRDQHFAPQWVSTFSAGITFDRIFFIEEFDPLRQFLNERGIDVLDFKHHATGAETRIAEYYGPREIEAVRALFQRDFELFGYDMDLNNLRPRQAEIVNQSETTILEDAMMVYAEVPPIEKMQHLERLAASLPGLDVDYLRYVAIGLSFGEKVAMARSLVEAGTVSNWRYASELGADLARVGAMGAAMPLLQMASQRISERLPARAA